MFINCATIAFQLSLWEGEVVFQNLELRLDVLEEELQLPFTFLSGHINDLKIMIPWTKISSEPITITINTIGKQQDDFMSMHYVLFTFLF